MSSLVRPRSLVAVMARASVTFGLLGNWLGSNAAPALNRTATR